MKLIIGEPKHKISTKPIAGDVSDRHLQQWTDTVLSLVHNKYTQRAALWGVPRAIYVGIDLSSIQRSTLQHVPHQ